MHRDLTGHAQQQRSNNVIKTIQTFSNKSNTATCQIQFQLQRPQRQASSAQLISYAMNI